MYAEYSLPFSKIFLRLIVQDDLLRNYIELPAMVDLIAVLWNIIFTSRVSWKTYRVRTPVKSPTTVPTQENVNILQYLYWKVLPTIKQEKNIFYRINWNSSRTETNGLIRLKIFCISFKILFNYFCHILS